MARNIADIEKEIFDSIAANENLVALTSPSKVSIWRILVFIIAYSIWVLELIFDQHKKEVETIITNQKSGRLQWYRFMALKFQYGFDLKTDSDEYDNGTASEDQIEASKKIKYCAVTELTSESRLVIKVAGDVGGVPGPIVADEEITFNAYLNVIKYAGVKHTIINALPDKLFLQIEIKRNPLLLLSDGMSILNSNYPVNDAIDTYIKQLPFDGAFVVFDFLRYIANNAEGVESITYINIETATINPDTEVYNDPKNVSIKTIPYSGYFTVDNFENITYVV